MTEFTTYKNAPITEALIDIRTLLPKETNISVLEGLGETIKEKYPSKEIREYIQTGFNLKEGALTEMATQKGVDGIFYRSVPEDNKIVQFRMNGFTFNKLKPYENWERFQKEGRDLWDLYYRIAKPIRITRIALRYINRIELPGNCKDLSEYLKNIPVLSKEIEQGFSHFFIRFVIPDKDLNATAVLTETLAQRFPTDKDIIPIVYDIDVYKKVSYEENIEDMWIDFDDLRKLKNTIFENSFTDKAKKMFL